MRISGKCCRKRLSNSSVTLDLPAPPVPVMPHRRAAAGELPFLALVFERSRLDGAALDRREHRGDGDMVVAIDAGGHAERAAVFLRAADEVLDHCDQAHLHAVVRVIDALDAVVVQILDLFRRDGATTAAEHTDMAGAALAQHVDHVLEVLGVPALVGGQRDAVGVFLDGGVDHVLHRAVVAKVDHFHALRLDQPTHDVDRGVVAVEQAGGGDEAQRALFDGAVAGRQLLRGGRAHAGSGSCDLIGGF